MALTASQKSKLRQVLLEFVVPMANGDVPLAMFEETWLAFFESAAERKTRAQGWVAAVRAQRAAALAAADAQNAARKAALDAEIAELDSITSNV